jgi:ribose/xylose/arabinose/galactoside ABC-type transport system permease subunit
MDSSPNPAPSPAAAATRRKRRRKSWAESLLGVRELPPGIGLVAVVLFFSLQTGNFWSPQTMTAISTVASTIAIVSVGVTMLMISGEFDLSVGQNFAFTPIVWAILFVSNGVNEWLALALALASSAGVGLVNGLVTTVSAFPPSLRRSACSSCWRVSTIY